MARKPKGQMGQPIGFRVSESVDGQIGGGSIGSGETAKELIAGCEGFPPATVFGCPGYRIEALELCAPGVCFVSMVRELGEELKRESAEITVWSTDIGEMRTLLKWLLEDHLGSNGYWETMFAQALSAGM